MSEEGADQHREPTRRPEDYAELTAGFQRLAQLAEGDPRRRELRDELVTSCLPLADDIAHRYRGWGRGHADLRRVAVAGLVDAINRFRPDQAGDFVAFAVPTVLGEVRRYVRETSWAARAPRRLDEPNARLGSAITELTRRLRRAPTARELAEHLQVGVEDVYEGLLAAAAHLTSTLSEPGEPAEAPVAVAEALDHVHDRESIGLPLGVLPERDRQIVRLRFHHQLSQSQIAQRMGLSQMEVSRLLAGALARLREHAAERGDAAEA